MFLTDVELEEQVRLDRIRFTPEVEPGQITTVSIDLRLGSEFRTPVERADRPIRPGRFTEQLDLDDIYGPPEQFSTSQPYHLDPRAFVLGHTLERVELPIDVGALIDGKSTNARLGLVVHATSAKVDPGWKGNLVLEISNWGKNCLVLDPEMLICQLLFFRVSTRPLKASSSIWHEQTATGRGRTRHT